MKITRWNPSTNGTIHLGHVYCLLVNERFAHDNGGKFYIRFDDTSQAITIDLKPKEHLEKIVEEQRKDIEWFGFRVDGWSYQSEILPEVHERMSKYAPCFLKKDPYPHYQPPSIRLGSTYLPYPYTPYQTAERVIMDAMLGITYVIRGEEFLTEYALYRYFCEVFEVGYPQFIHLPRLMSKHGDISKTNGGYTIAEMRGCGYTPNEIVRMLELACLTYPNNGWSLENLRANPRIDI